SARQGWHQAAQKSTTTGTSRERSMTAISNVVSLTSITVVLPIPGRHGARTALGEPPSPPGTPERGARPLGSALEPADRRAHVPGERADVVAALEHERHARCETRDSPGELLVARLRHRHPSERIAHGGVVPGGDEQELGLEALDRRL